MTPNRQPPINSMPYAPLFLNIIRHTPSHLSDHDLRQQLNTCHIDSRRLSRITRLSLAALLPALDTAAPAEHLFLATPSGSIPKLESALHRLFDDNLPHLIDFNAALPNAALFACSQVANIANNSVFCAVSHDNLMQPLWLAANTLWQQGGRAWIGWAYEASPDSNEADGSIWWQISTQAEQESHAILHLKTGNYPLDIPHKQPFWHYTQILTEQNLLPSGGNCGLHWHRQKVSLSLKENNIA